MNTTTAIDLPRDVHRRADELAELGRVALELAYESGAEDVAVLVIEDGAVSVAKPGAIARRLRACGYVHQAKMLEEHDGVGVLVVTCLRDGSALVSVLLEPPVGDA